MEDVELGVLHRQVQPLITAMTSTAAVRGSSLGPCFRALSRE